MRLADMCSGLFIVDEVHSYDPRSIALILESLKILKREYNASIAIMSATVPKFLKEMFRNELGIETIVSPEAEKLKKC